MFGEIKCKKRKHHNSWLSWMHAALEGKEWQKFKISVFCFSVGGVYG